MDSALPDKWRWLDGILEVELLNAEVYWQGGIVQVAVFLFVDSSNSRDIMSTYKHKHKYTNAALYQYHVAVI